MTQDPTLLWLVVLPMIAAVFAIPTSNQGARWLALMASLFGFFLGVWTYLRFDGTDTGFQMRYALSWWEPYAVRFSLGVDGLSLPLVALTKFMMPIAVLASWNEKRTKGLMISFLVLDAAMTGTFLATDIFLFYVFWEMMLIPMILIIGVWGSTERIYAAVKFFLYTFAGSIFMLVAIFYLFHSHFQQFGYHSAEIQDFYKLVYSSEAVFLGLAPADWIFLAFLIAFAIKVPLFPLHTWLPDAHVQAPTGGSVLLAAVLLKMGTYGLLRFCVPIAPISFLKFIPVLVVLSLVGILYGAWVAFAQTDIKKLIAYSSVSHLGFVVLGICAANTIALTGSMLQMVNHGISSGALFLLAGILYERRHSKRFSDFGGLAKQLPWFTFFFVFVSASSMAVPGLNGFVGEFLILMGTFQTNPAWAGIAALGVIFAAAYILIMLRKVLFGPITSDENRKLADLGPRDYASLIPLAILIVWMGVYPGFFLEKLRPTYERYWSTLLPRVGHHQSEPENTLPIKVSFERSEK